MQFNDAPLLNISLGDYDGILEGLITSLEKTYAATAPKFKKAVEEWAKATTAKSKENLNRPQWLLSRSLSQVVRKYEKSSKIWALSGVTKDGKGVNDPARYVRFHESGWRPKARGGGRYKPKVEPHFMRKAKEATHPLFKANVETISKEIAKTFERELAALNSRKKEDARLRSRAYRKRQKESN